MIDAEAEIESQIENLPKSHRRKSDSQFEINHVDKIALI
jgi:hypothetical protein